MGQKVNPVSLRLGIIRSWYSRWYADGDTYRNYLHEDLELRKYIKQRMYQAGISTIDIERTTQRVIINIHSAKPGMVIGKRGVEIELLRNELQQRIGRQVFVNIHEVRVPEVDAQLVAENIAAQLLKRVSYRRIIKKIALLTMRGGAKGVKSALSGRLGGGEIARYHRDVLGKVPLHTLRAEVDYGHATAYTAHGTIGVKVWIYKGDALPLRGVKQISPSQRGRRRQEEQAAAPGPSVAAAPASGANVAVAAPADQLAVPTTAPTDQPAVPTTAPADQPAVPAAAPADQPAVTGAAPTDQSTVPPVGGSTTESSPTVPEKS